MLACIVPQSHCFASGDTVSAWIHEHASLKSTAMLGTILYEMMLCGHPPESVHVLTYEDRLRLCMRSEEDRAKIEAARETMRLERVEMGRKMTLPSPDLDAFQALLDSELAQVLEKRHARAFNECLRKSLADLCSDGDVATVKFLLDRGLGVNDPCWLFMNELDATIGATPLFVAAYNGQANVMTLLLSRDANPNLAASDGKTPVWAACMQNHVAALNVLGACNADMAMPDHDGTAPVHIAAAFDSIDAIQWLYRAGVDMSQAGSIYLHDYSQDEQQAAQEAKITAEEAAMEEWVTHMVAARAEGAAALTDDELLQMARTHQQENCLDTEDSCWSTWIDYKNLRTGMTPLMVARRCQATDVVQFLQKICCLKRVRSTLTLEERADAAGVPRARLKVIPQSLIDESKSGVKENSEAAKKAIQNIQIANQQIVARAEKAGARCA